MILGLMQPYFLPYLEHFRLLAACDRWVVFDTVGYRRKTRMNRNRIINRSTGWCYISVPVKEGATRGSAAAARPGDIEPACGSHVRIAEEQQIGVRPHDLETSIVAPQVVRPGRV